MAKAASMKTVKWTDGRRGDNNPVCTERCSKVAQCCWGACEPSSATFVPSGWKEKGHIDLRGGKKKAWDL